jgi:hypothetical protein
MMLSVVEIAAITAIVLGAMLFVLGLLPGLLGSMTEGLRNFRDHPSTSRGPIHNIQTICGSMETFDWLSAED